MKRRTFLGLVAAVPAFSPLLVSDIEKQRKADFLSGKVGDSDPTGIKSVSVFNRKLTDAEVELLHESVAFNADGTKVYLDYSEGKDETVVFNLSTNFDLSTAVLDEIVKL